MKEQTETTIETHGEYELISVNKSYTYEEICNLSRQALRLLENKHFRELRTLLINMEPTDLALLLREIEEEDLPLIFRVLPKELAAQTFVEMDIDDEQVLIHAFSDMELKEVMEQLFLDDTVDIIEEMPANVVSRIIRAVTPEKRNIINEVLNYHEDSAGSIMTIEYIDLRSNLTVEDAFKRIRRTALNKETVYTCYVTDENRRLIGLVTALTLMISDEDTIIGDIMETGVISVETTDDKEFVASQIQKYDLLALPVVDGENRLVGIVTVDDAMDVISEETEEDFVKMSAMTPIEDSYFKTSIFSHSSKRIIWLLILMLSATITGIIITSYENAFTVVPILVAFIPMLMDTGGNCGAQSSTMIIRGMAVGEIHLHDYYKVLFKEVRIGLFIGISLAAVNFVRVLIQYRDIKLGIVLGLTLMAAALMAKTLGCTLPMLAKKAKIDPALMASPLITTIVDGFTVFLYFNIAIKIMGI